MICFLPSSSIVFAPGWNTISLKGLVCGGTTQAHASILKSKHFVSSLLSYRCALLYCICSPFVVRSIQTRVLSLQARDLPWWPGVKTSNWCDVNWVKRIWNNKDVLIIFRDVRSVHFDGVLWHRRESYSSAAGGIRLVVLGAYLSPYGARSTSSTNPSYLKDSIIVDNCSQLTKNKDNAEVALGSLQCLTGWFLV